MKVAKEIDWNYTTGTSDDKKIKTDEIAMSTIILHRSDNVLCKVDKARLENLYLEKNLCLIESFSSNNSSVLKWTIQKDLDANMDVFNCLILNIANCKVTFSDENNAVLLLDSLPETYKEDKNAIKYGGDELTINIIVNALRFRT